MKTYVCNFCDSEMPLELTTELYISVKERLPKPPMACLVVLDIPLENTGLETIASYEQDEWNIYDDQLKHYPVTHWMPLPPLPKKES